jgi:hypothetical protein
MTEIDATKYRIIPGGYQVIDIDLDTAGLHTLSGDPITEESCHEASLDAERKYRAGLIPGGKSLSGGGKHSPRFQVILGENTAEQVREAAHQEHMSVSKWLRRTVEEKLAA